MPAGVNSVQRRAAMAAASVTAALPRGVVGQVAGYLGGVPSLTTAVFTAVFPYVPKVVRALTRDVISHVFPQPTAQDLMLQATATYAPRLVPIIAASFAITVTHVGMFIKLVKLARSLVAGPQLIGAEHRLSYSDQFPAKKVEISASAVCGTLGCLIICFGKHVAREPGTWYRRGKVTTRDYRRYGLALLVPVLVRVMGALLAKYAYPIGAKFTTRLIDQTKVNPVISSSNARQIFVSTPLVRAGATRNHTHGKSAADRNAGSATAALVATSLGKEPYYLQKSLSDVRKNRPGDRTYHWPKDLAVPSAEFSFDATKQCAIMVDVDYYVDMPHLLANYPGTYFISTFCPTAAAVGKGEYTFRFLEDGKVHYRVSGGAEYTHHIWDYSGDAFCVKRYGLTKQTIVAYHIDRKPLDDHHALIMLTVISQFDLPSVIPADFVLPHAKMRRFKPIFGNHVVLDVVKPTGLERSVAILGDHTSVTLPKTSLDAVHAVALVAKVPITPAMVASNIAPSDPVGLPTAKLDPGAAPIIASYIRAGVPHFPPVVYPAPECVIPVYFDKHDYDAPQHMKAFGSPLIGPCYSYVESLASDDACIKGRVEAFTKKPTITSIPPKLAGYMQEYLKFLIPEPHTLHPLGLDQVQEYQERATQRAILDEAHYSGPFYRRMWRTFVKKETAVKPSDPRNISTATPQAKLHYSAFMYAFHEGVMKHQKWYAFNKTPIMIAKCVTQILKDAPHAVPADAGRYDGHVSFIQRILERAVALRAFNQQHHQELTNRLDEQIGLPAVTSNGRKYDSEYSRASGSSETSGFNSIGTSFTGYAAWRETTTNGRFHTPEEAWEKMGIYGGDDSLEGGIDPEALERVAKMIGQEYKIKIIKRGDPGVEFLNRQFGPDVWTGDPNSMANPARALAKLWVGPAHLKDPLERFAERMSGYYRMDRNSPVLGDICRLAHMTLGERTEGVLMPWAGSYDTDTNWPNEDSGWMVDTFNQFIPDFDWDRFRNWLRTVASDFAEDRKETILHPPLCTAAPTTPTTSTTPCVIGDHTVVHPTASTPAPEVTIIRQPKRPSGKGFKPRGQTGPEIEVKASKKKTSRASTPAPAASDATSIPADIQAVVDDTPVFSHKVKKEKTDIFADLPPLEPVDAWSDLPADLTDAPTEDPRLTEAKRLASAWRVFPTTKGYTRKLTREEFASTSQQIRINGYALTVDQPTFEVHSDKWVNHSDKSTPDSAKEYNRIEGLRAKCNGLSAVRWRVRAAAKQS